jgi:hypothetical protein
MIEEGQPAPDFDLATDEALGWFFTDHDTNSANTILAFCAEQIGMDTSNFGDPMDVTAHAVDLYFDGPGDAVDDITIAPLGERFLGVFDDGSVGATTIPARDRVTLEYLDFGAGPNTTETGLLVFYRNGMPEDGEASDLVLVN